MKNSRGFTLIEVMTATTIAAVISVSILVVFLNATAVGRLTKEKLIATRICQGKIEEYRRMTFAEIASLQNPLNTNTTLPLVNVSELTNGQMSVKINNYSAPTAKIKELIATISWTGPGNQPKYLSINTLIADKGLND